MDGRTVSGCFCWDGLHSTTYWGTWQSGICVWQMHSWTDGGGSNIEVVCPNISCPGECHSSVSFEFQPPPTRVTWSVCTCQ